MASVSQMKPQPYKGKGIVIVASGLQHLTNAWITIRLLRVLGTKLPVQLWHSARSLDLLAEKWLKPFGVECIDGSKFGAGNDSPAAARKLIAALYTRFKEVLLLDADNLSTKPAEYLFACKEYQETGAVLWEAPDLVARSNPLWRILKLRFSETSKIDSAQMLIDKGRCFDPLAFATRFATDHPPHSVNGYDIGELISLVWKAYGTPAATPQTSPQVLTVSRSDGLQTDAAFCQHDFLGERAFQHRNKHKWSAFSENPWIAGFFFENECREFLAQIRKRWAIHFKRGAGLISKRTPLSVRTQDELVASRWLIIEEQAIEPSSPQVPTEKEIPYSKGYPGYAGLPGVTGVPNIQFTEKAVQCSPAQSSRQNWTERTFRRDGLVGDGASEECGFIWRLEQSKDTMILRIENEHAAVAEFSRRTSTKWEGNWLSTERSKGRILLKTVEEAFDQLPGGKVDRDALLKRLPSPLEVTCNSISIGDHITTTYVCAALTRLGVPTVFRSRYSQWLSRVVEPGLTISNEPSECAIDVNSEPWQLLRYGESRAKWFARAFHPQLRPIRPRVNRKVELVRVPFRRYVVFGPSGSKLSNWPDCHWAKLAHLFRQDGFDVLVVGSQDQAGSLMTAFGQTQAFWAVEHPPSWIADVLLNSEGFIGVDNDLMHFANLLMVKSFAIHSQFPSSFLWAGTNTTSITPNVPCVFCRLQSDNGFQSTCISGCSAIATLSPEQIHGAFKHQ